MNTCPVSPTSTVQDTKITQCDLIGTATQVKPGIPDRLMELVLVQVSRAKTQCWISLNRVHGGSSLWDGGSSQLCSRPCPPQQVAHFEPVQVQVLVEGTYPCVTLNLPRVKDTMFEACAEEARER